MYVKYMYAYNGLCNNYYTLKHIQCIIICAYYFGPGFQLLGE